MGESMSEITEAILDTSVGLIRYSAILKRLVGRGLTSLAVATTKEVDDAGRTCPEHGHLDDPIVAIVVGLDGKRLIVACPLCSGPGALALWESQAVETEDASDD